MKGGWRDQEREKAGDPPTKTTPSGTAKPHMLWREVVARSWLPSMTFGLPSWLLVTVPRCCHRSSLLPPSCYGRGIWKLHTWQQVNTRPPAGTEEYKDSCFNPDTWTEYPAVDSLKGKRKICDRCKSVLNNIYNPILITCTTH